MPGDDVFPILVCCANLDAMREKGKPLYDVKFYPFPTKDGDQIFAAAGEQDVFICRMMKDQDRPFEILRWFGDSDPTTSINSLTWTKDPVTGRPLLCLAGSKPTHIKILDIDTGEPVRTFPGHGKAINDLAVSPLSTNIIASASEDYTIRLWNLHPKHAHQPCVAIFAGEGHKQPLLAMAFHPNGRWLLSGGLDTAVCLWSVPSFDELDRKGLKEEELEQHQDPKIIYYPHFHSTEVHHNYVDSLQFYGDLILSKAARDGGDRNKKNEVLLWKIEGFEPDAAPPTEPPIPAPDKYTRSSFDHPPRSAGFQRLLSFQIEHTDRFYHRFGLLHEPNMRPILCMGLENSTFCFWDLQDLEEGKVHVKSKAKKGGRTAKKGKANVSEQNLNRLDGLKRAESVASESTMTGTGTGTGGGKSTPLHSTTSLSHPLPDRKQVLSDPFYQLPPHNTQTAGTKLPILYRGKHKDEKHFATQQCAWSPDGRWMVAVGDMGMVCIFYRDESVVNGVGKA